tara:strand:+ start:37 stop:144 length:108 start_codon:yes stop_codon:yes gene_type:complete
MSETKTEVKKIWNVTKEPNGNSLKLPLITMEAVEE